MCETSRCIIRLRGEKAILLDIQANIVGHQRYLHTPRITLGGEKIACTQGPEENRPILIAGCKCPLYEALSHV